MKTFKKCSFCNQFSLLPKVEYDDKGQLHQEIISIKTKLGGTMPIRKNEYEAVLKSVCHTCGQSLISYHWSEEEIIEYFKKLYKEFMKFVGDTAKDLPSVEDVEFIIENEGNVHYAGRCYFDNKLGKMIVGIRKNQIQNINELPAIMSHEYDHIFGLYDPITKKKKNNKSNWFSELKASETETKVRVGWKTINDNKKIRLYQKIYFDKHYVTLYEFLKNIIVGYMRDINKSIGIFKKFGILQSFDVLCITRTIPYYYGTINFIKQYLDERDIKKIPDINLLETLINGGLIDRKKNEQVFNRVNQLFKDLDDCANGLSEDIDGKLFDKIMLDITYELGTVVDPSLMRFNNPDDFKNDIKKREKPIIMDDKEKNRRKAFKNCVDRMMEGVRVGIKTTYISFDEIIKDTNFDKSSIPFILEAFDDIDTVKITLQENIVQMDNLKN